MTGTMRLFLLLFAAAGIVKVGGAEAAGDSFIEYRGERFKLTKASEDYDAHKKERSGQSGSHGSAPDRKDHD